MEPVQPQNGGTRPTAQTAVLPPKKRNLFLCILFSLLTLGIYSVYWFVCMTNETNRLSKFPTAGGGMAILFTIITFGIYYLYWTYMLGKKIGDIEGGSSDGLFYIILNLLGLGFIPMLLAQSRLNRKAV